MARILLIGMAPLPWEQSRMHMAPGQRTWQLARPLLEDGHRVHLLTFGEVGQPGSGPGPGELTRAALSAGDFLDAAVLQAQHDRFAPEGIVTASSYQPTLAAARLHTDRPLWVDLPGDLMAEAQLRAALGPPDRGQDPLPGYRSILLAALSRGDHFSVVSERQRLALVGQLGLAGRLGRGLPPGHELASVIPAGVSGPGPEQEPGPGPAWPWPDDAFVVLSCGGYNTWADVDTLFEGLVGAMTGDQRIHFASSGGAIPGHAERPHARLQHLVQGSPLRRRFHLLGWLLPGELCRLYRRGNLGLNVDRACYEAELGSRNRILDWLRCGLPCATTPCTELARDLARQDLVASFPPGDARALARTLLALAADEKELRARAELARTLVSERYSYGRTTAPLRAWAENPRRAPDASCQPALPVDPDILRAELQRLEQDLGAIRASASFRVLWRAERLLRPVLQAARRIGILR